jgi:hypothetical protein
MMVLKCDKTGRNDLTELEIDLMNKFDNKRILKIEEKFRHKNILYFSCKYYKNGDF